MRGKVIGECRGSLGTWVGARVCGWSVGNTSRGAIIIVILEQRRKKIEKEWRLTETTVKTQAALLRANGVVVVVALGVGIPSQKERRTRVVID